MTKASAIKVPQRYEEVKCQSFEITADVVYAADSRFDATNYAQAAYQALSAIQSAPAFRCELGNLCGTIWHPVQNQARSNFKRIYVNAQHGVPYVGSREMFFFPLRPEKYLSKRIPKLQDLMVPEGWLLVSRSGTVGNVLYAYNRLSRCAITDHAIRIEPTKVPAGYLYAFLASKYGQPLISQSTYGSTVDELEPKHLASIPVPLFDNDSQAYIHDKIIRAYQLRDQANGLFDNAEIQLYSILGVDPFTEDDIEYFGSKAEVKAFDINSGELGVRFDATHHVPIARSVITKLKHGKYPLVGLGSIVSQVYLAPRFARIYVEADHGTPLLQGSHVLMMRVHDLKFISNTQTVKMDRWIITNGTVLITCSGTIGRVAIATAKMHGWAASQHILRIIGREGSSHPGFLATFLLTPYGQHQLQAKIYGGVVDELTAEDTEIVLIPRAPYSEQEKVGATVLKAYELRDEANDLEDEAIRQLENLIAGNSSSGSEK